MGRGQYQDYVSVRLAEMFCGKQDEQREAKREMVLFSVRARRYGRFPDL